MATNPVNVGKEEMQEMPAPPPAGEVLDEQRLYLAQIGLYRNTLAFGGQVNPSVIWTSMSRNESTAIAYYRELEEKDEDVGNCLDSLKLSVAEREYSIQPGDDSAAAVNAAEFIKRQLEELPSFDAVLDTMLDAPGYGFSVQEMIFDISEGQVELEDIHDCPQELFLFGNRFRPQVGQLQLLDSPWAVEGVPQPEQKFMVFTYRGRGRNRMGRPLLRNVFWPSWFKRNAQTMWLRYAEKGPGTAVVRYNDSDSDAQKQRAAELAKSIIDLPAIAVPSGFTYDAELLKIARALDPSVYEHLYRALQYNIARRILGETLTSFGNEGGKGSNAQGEVHADTFALRSVSTTKLLTAVINRQLVRPLVLWNFGPDVPMPRYVAQTDEEEDLTALSTVLDTLQGMGLKIPEAYVHETFGVPQAQGQEPVLEPNKAVPPPVALPGARESFSEGEREWAQYDQLFAQLKGESREIYRQRVKQILAAATAGRA